MEAHVKWGCQHYNYRLITNINLWYKEPPCGYQNCITSHILVFWWVCEDERIFVYLSHYLGITILIIWILGRFCLHMKVLAWYISPNSIKNKNIVKYSYLIGLKECELLIVDTWMVSKKVVPDQHCCVPILSRGGVNNSPSYVGYENCDCISWIVY